MVHLHLFDASGNLYLQHRPAWKDIQPDKWDTAVGGHVDLGESVADALKREAAEELGVTDFEPEFLLSYTFRSEREQELVYVFRTVYNGVVTPSDELDGGRFWSIGEIENAMGKGILTPNFEQEYAKIASKIAIIREEYGYRLQNSANKLYRNLQTKNALDVIDKEDDVASAIFLLSGIEELGKDAHTVAQKLGGNYEKVAQIIALATSEKTDNVKEKEDGTN